MFSELKKPTLLFRGMVLACQGVMWNWFFCMYLLSPRFCHSFVGYLEESAVHTYTSVINACGEGQDLHEWGQKPATALARKYYHLPENATMRDVLLNVRLDEKWHQDTNHEFSELDWDTAFNPHAEEHIEFRSKLKSKLERAATQASTKTTNN